MDPGERLAGYLAGEGTEPERRALEAELARDPALRRRLDAIRRSDAALAALGDVEPPAGFRAALAATVDTEMARQHQRRRRVSRARPARSWAPAAAAAAVVVVGGLGVAVGSLLDLGADDTANPQAASEAGGTAAATGRAPVLVARDRSLSAEGLDAVAGHDAFDLAAEQLAGDEAADVAARFAADLGVASGDVAAPDPRDPRDAGDLAASGTGTAEDTATTGSADTVTAGRTSSATGADSSAVSAATATPPDLGAAVRGEASPRALAAVRRCLPPLLTAGGIPVYAEVATFEGAPAVVYGILGEDPVTGVHDRAEVWAIDQRTCEVRQFAVPRQQR